MCYGYGPMAITNKDRALFWLSRRIRELESKSTPPAHEDMALAGLSYAQRQELLAQRAKAQDDHAGELAALREVREFVVEQA